MVRYPFFICHFFVAEKYGDYLQKFWDILNFFENLPGKEIDFHFFLQLLLIEGKILKCRDMGTDFGKVNK